MKIKLTQSAVAAQRSGFTLIEALIVMVTLVILAGTIILTNLWGASMAVRQQIWLSSSDDAAQALGKMFTDIRAGASNYVGNGNLAGFTNAGSNIWQQGNALKIMLANTNGVTNGSWILYYYDPATSNLYRTNWTGSNSGDFRLVTANMVMTNNMYNSNIFSAYNVYNGVWMPETNGVGTPLVLVCLAFTELQNPQVVIASGSTVDFYQITTRIASRNRP
ncbi:MAG TPA: prepilin-type N-terminal cleavage/methylation domain-containing protein [Verrucomicrobiae bacterium]|jgi:type II secretory pathway pseudopilin PulG